jgi:hypothetical protein
MNLRCLVCGNQEFMKKQQKEFVEICLSGTEYSSQTLKNIDSNITFSKVNIKTIIYYYIFFTNLN